MSKTFMSLVLFYTRSRARFYGKKSMIYMRVNPGTVLHKSLMRAFELAVENDIPLKTWADAQEKMAARVGHFPYASQYSNDGALQRALELDAERGGKIGSKMTPIKKWKTGYAARIRKYRRNKERWFQFINPDFFEDDWWTGSDGRSLKKVYYRLDKIKYHNAHKPKLKKKLRKRLKALFRSSN